MVDLHMHSTASDGTDSIPVLLENLRRAGIQIFSVTDHDTVAGTLEMEGMVPEDMRFIRGVELSCITEAGKCHILGYGYQSDVRAFQEILEEGSRKRRDKLERRLSFLEERFGIRFSAEELQRLRAMQSAGKPHLGRLLSEKGFGADKDEAIEKYLNPCKTESDRVDGVKAVQAILLSGGIPVWAHPLGGTGEKAVQPPQFARQLSVLKAAGILGMECYYSKYTEPEVRLLCRTAEENGLLISGGSDYHGRNKTVRLGELNAYGEAVHPSQLSILSRLLH